MDRRQRVDILFHEQPRLRIGRVHVPAGSELWNRVCVTAPTPVLAFPRVPFALQPESFGEPVVANANQVLLCPPGMRYRRRCLSPAGEVSDLIWFDIDVLETALADFAFEPVVPGAIEPQDVRYPRLNAPCDPRTRLLELVLIESVRADPSADPLLVEECVHELLRRSHASAYGYRNRRHPNVRNATARIHRSIIRGSIEFISSRLDQRLTLGEVAETAHCAPHHFARLFRRCTDRSLHAYVTELRLNSGLLRLEDYRRNTAGLALELGFSGRTHLSERFTRHFGLSVREVRELLARPSASLRGLMSEMGEQDGPTA